MRHIDRTFADALERGDFAAAQQARAAGADPNSRFHDVPLICQASLIGRFDVVEFLLNSGASVDSRDPDGRTAFNYAGWVGTSPDHLKILAALIDYGADVAARDSFGRTGLDMAIIFSNRHTATFLAEKQVPCAPSNRTWLPRLLEKAGPQRL